MPSHTKLADRRTAPDRSAARATWCAASCLLLCAGIAAPPTIADESLPQCVYVSSYHPGYNWSDRLEAGLREGLDARCTITSTYMDTKRRRSEADKQQAVQAALDLIRDVDPAVVITSDDNAAKYLIVPHLADTPLPVVFSGVNWTVEEYGFPRPNVTGMVEVSPLRPMIRQAISSVPGARRAAFLSANTLSEWKNFERLDAEAQAAGVQLMAMHVDDMDHFDAAFETAQDYDFVIIGGYSGIRDWDPERARRTARERTRTLSLTTRDWMMPYTILGYTKLPEEQGEWAAASAIAVIDGRSPASIPLVTNRRWDSWLNAELLERSGIELPRSVLRKAKQIDTR